jgi:beta-mannanase
MVPDSLACVLVPSSAGRNPYISLVERNIWIGAYAPPAPWDSMAAVTELEKTIGRHLDIVHIYTAWGETWGAYNSETIRELYSATSDGRHALVTWEPWALGQGVDQDDFALSRIAAGSFDTYIRTWARGLRSFRNVIYLRPMHEMNGDWYPWGIGVNGNNPQGYIRAWRHIWGIFEQEKVTNVRWIWCPYAADSSAANMLELAYPGDKYVDLLGLDIYNWGTSIRHGESAQDSGRWEDVEECLGVAYRRISRFAPQPIWLAEVGCAEDGGDKAKWLKGLFDSSGYERISAFIFFDVDKELDWRVDSSAASRAAVAGSLAGTRPAAEAEIAPAPPFGVRAADGLTMIEVSWSSVGDISVLAFAVTVFIGDKVLRTSVVGPSAHYTFADPDRGASYSFAVQAVSRFGASAMSELSTPVQFN